MILTKLYYIGCMYEYVTTNPIIMYYYNAPMKNVERENKQKSVSSVQPWSWGIPHGCEPLAGLMLAPTETDVGPSYTQHGRQHSSCLRRTELDSSF